MDKQIELFIQNLENRFNKYDISEISEDCIRYDYFASLSTFVDTSDIVLEYPHPIYKKSRIDCVVNYPNNNLVAKEFKFFRSIPSGKNIPQTQLIGQIFKDIYKLKSFKEANIKKLIVVTNGIMANYMNNQFSLFDNMRKTELEIKISSDTLNKQENTFQKSIVPFKNIDLEVKRIFCKLIMNRSDIYVVAIFEIL